MGQTTIKYVLIYSLSFSELTFTFNQTGVYIVPLHTVKSNLILFENKMISFEILSAY